MSDQPSTATEPKTLFGHPRGLYVLFFTELWERFSFYGMKTLLMLYMLNHFFWSQEEASSLLGWYAFLAYGLPVVGGFVADRYLGAKRAVILGGILLSIGHILMAFEPLPYFYTALGFIIAGVGLLKPNVSTQVGSLYKPEDPRRDGAFTIFYMGINLGALIGPLLCDWLRVHYGWHYGFGAAGVGMIFGLIVYVIGLRYLDEFKQDVDDEGHALNDTRAAAPPKDDHPRHVVRDRLIVLLVVFAFIILFWTAFEQSPNAMLVWADKNTNLNLFSMEPPPVTLGDAATAGEAATTSFWPNGTTTSGQTQSINPFFIITLAPIFAAFWIWLHKRGLQPSTPAKMAIGLGFVTVAFGVMWPAAQSENQPTSAALAEFPSGLSVDEGGFICSVEVAEDGTEERTFYGSKRLRYDAGEGELQMSGVLTDLDRFRLLAETAPDDFVEAVQKFAERSAAEDNSRKDETWSISTVVGSAPAGIAAGDVMTGEGKSRKRVLSWDPETQTVTAYGEIKDRAQTEFLAKAADPGFKTAVDSVYLASSEFRVSIWWLIAFFMTLTMGELCISPVGLSLVTKLAPAKHVGLLMGGWFLATAVAEKLAQVFGAWWGRMPPGDYFLIFIVMCAVGAVLMALVVKPLKRKMHGVH